MDAVSAECQAYGAPPAGRMGKKHQAHASLTEDLIYEILSAVGEVPEGKVASYGQIARLVGREKNARLVGKVLSMSEYYGDYPCHRIVNHAGRLAPHFHRQRDLLLQEHIIFKGNGCVDMKKCQWDY